MPAPHSKLLGGDRLLAHLRADLHAARSSILVVGPWLDSFFADIVAEASPRVRIRVVTRPRETAGPEGWMGNVACMERLAGRFTDFAARLLPKLHAKAIVIDDALVYVGSANWYRHSLEQARELVIRCQPAALDDGVEDVEAVWRDAEASNAASNPTAGGTARPAPKPRPPGPRVEATTDREVVDPLAKHVLDTVPKAFVLGRKKR